MTILEEPSRLAIATQMRRSVQTIERWIQRTVHRGTGTDLSPNEIHLLSHLADEPPQRMSALAERQGVDRSTMSLRIRTLVQRGLAQRLPDPTDRRATMVELSDEGREMFEEYIGRASRILERTVQEWSDADLAHFEHYLTRFAADLTTALEKESAGPAEGEALEI